ncbi:Alpha/Beta hydrolase protein [Trichoderma velutinum]
MAQEGTISCQLPGGTITALHERGLIRARGIPYAKAGRFQPPTLLDTWTDIVDCTKAAPICPQRPSRLNFVTGDLIEGREMSEDCLNLSIIAPPHPLDQNKKLPVLVWFHGGAFVSGGGDLDCYSPWGLAKRGVVVVNVTYRLGIFGYMEIDGVASANLGLWDQITALKWVQKNISGFGGNPEQVTVAGQSAGAQSIFYMMISDEAKGLFQRAILQSTPLGRTAPPEDVSRQLSNLAKSLIGDNPATISQDRLLDIETDISLEARRLGLSTPGFWPQLGKFPLPQEAEIPQRIEDAAQRYKVMIGWTQDEGNAFVTMIPYISSWFKYPLLGPFLQSCASKLFSRSFFIQPSQLFHQQLLHSGGNSTTFAFQWSPRENPQGAVHCIELPLLFGDWSSWEKAPMMQGVEAREDVEKLSVAVKNLWVAFAAGETLGDSHFVIDRNFTF